MKKPLFIVSGVLGLLVLTAVLLHTLPINGHSSLNKSHFPHGNAGQNEPITIQLNEPGFMTCGQPFFDSIYKETKDVFSVGADNIVLSDYENRIFTLIRHSDRFKDDPEPFIDHVKDVLRQTIDIVKEDPEVLDSCENFSVAMSGPQ